MIKLRLRRTGKNKLPSYQIIAIDSRKARDAIYLEKIGHYFPIQNKYDINKELTLKWLFYGAQPTKTVKNILKKEKIIEEFVIEKQRLLKIKKQNKK